ncbi:MAG: hypothetical protein IJJ41_08820 [Clostridia bacterium]|nr:hypothetical protein [Clostridia bacterium]
MDENKKEIIDTEENDALAQEAQAEETVEKAEVVADSDTPTELILEEETQARQDSDTDEAAAPQADEQAEADSTFSVESVDSEDALTELLNSGESAEEDSDSAEEEVEQEMQLATYAADCESCATKVFFELEDLDEENNLTCPNCSETIEINTDAIDYYLVKKEDSQKEADESEGAYVVDCTACEAVVHFTQEDIDDEENIVCPQCGEKIHIETEVLDAYHEKGFEKSLKKKKILKRVLASVTGVVLALAISCAVIWFAGNKSVVKVGGTSVPMNVYKCVYYIETASNYVSAGYNPEEKPSAQPYEESEDFKTWDDFLKNQTNDVLKLYYGIYNQGKEEGYEMSEKDMESVESALKSLKSGAESAKLTFEDYMKSNYSLKISEKDFTEYLTLTAYVNSYYKHVMAKEVSKKQLKEIYDANPENFQVVTFRYFYVQVNDSVKKEDALKSVENIAKAKNEKEFQALVMKNVSKDKASQYEDENATLVKDMACANIVDRPVAEFLNNPKSKKYQTTFGLSEDETFAEVAMLIEPKHKDDDLILDTAINEVSTEKGQKYVDDMRENTVIKSSLGMIIRNLTF